jgi:hypothetical protein
MPRTILLAAIVLLVTGNILAQGNSATQVIILGVEPVTRLEVSAQSGPLVVRWTKDAPGAPSDAGTGCSFLSNVDQVKISASIGAPLPEGIRLRMRFESTLGLSRGDVDISSPEMPSDLLTGIRRGAATGRLTVYALSPDNTIRDLPERSRTIVLTVTN